MKPISLFTSFELLFIQLMVEVADFVGHVILLSLSSVIWCKGLKLLGGLCLIFYTFGTLVAHEFHWSIRDYLLIILQKVC